MKRFTPEAIKGRMMERLRISEDWAPILQEGTIGNLLDTIVEGEAELARYEEFLLGEKKWKTAMNFSSLAHQADLIGYKRGLPQSATGYIIASHTDDTGKDRLANYGTYFFDIDAESDYDDLQRTPTQSLEKTKALVPWTNSTPYIIPEGTRFITNKGIEFISTKTITSRVLTKPWSQIKNSKDELLKFKELGGWNGIKYQKIPVIQGIKRSASIGQTSAKRFEAFTFNKLDVEAAQNSISSKFFKIKLKKGDIEETWVEVDNIYRAGPYDRVFEKKILQNGTGILIKFGDGISGKLPPQGYTVYIEYLETLGLAGNINAKYQISQVVYPKGFQEIDPRTNVNTKFISCTNIVAIQGGKDIESQEEFRKNAPVSYLKSYTIGTADSYLDQIMKRSPLSLLHCKVYPGKTLTTKRGTENGEEKVKNFCSIVSSNLQISAVLSNGEVLDETAADEALIKPLLLSLNGQISPNDTFTYVKPNLIKFAPSIKVRSKNLSINEEEVKGLIKAAVSSEYDIFNQEFNEPLYTSKIIELSSIFKWVNSVEVINEASANISYNNIEINPFTNEVGDSPTSQSEILVSIPFDFNKIFVKNKYKTGFKNYINSADYLLKINVNFKNGSDSIKDRTFFLYDNRDEDTKGILSSDEWIENSKVIYENGKLKHKSIKVSDFNINFIDETDPDVYNANYESRNMRIAQFEYIKNITDSKLMSQAKGRSTSPEEIKYLVQDNIGNKKFFISEVTDPNLIVSGNNEASSDGSNSTCFKKDIRYTPNINISFKENYFEVNPKTAGNGYFTAPLSFFNFPPSSINIADYKNENFKSIVSTLLKSYVDIEVLAVPNEEVFEPENQNDICFVDHKRIRVEKETIY